MARVGVGLAVAGLGLSFASAAALQSLPSTDGSQRLGRAEIPLRAVGLPDGAMQYAVDLTVNGRKIEAMVDTGSTGLRVMARGLPGIAAGPRQVQYTFATETQLVGTEVQVPVALSVGRPIPLPVMRISAVRCLAGHPTCPAANDHDPATFGIMGEGKPGAGFVAIFGTNIYAEPIPNPLQAFGASRWIVEGPQNLRDSGRIVLNPSDAEAQGFSMLPMAPRGNNFPVCIEGPGIGGRYCGVGTFDTGTVGIDILTAGRPGATHAGGSVRVSIGPNGRAASFSFVNGGEGKASRIGFSNSTSGTVIHLGLLPYRRLYVLYDAERHAIGVKPR